MDPPSKKWLAPQVCIDDNGIDNRGLCHVFCTNSPLCSALYRKYNLSSLYELQSFVDPRAGCRSLACGPLITGLIQPCE